MPGLHISHPNQDSRLVRQESELGVTSWSTSLEKLLEDPLGLHTFAVWLAKLELVHHMIWTDEAKSNKTGSVDHHNCVYWHTENSHLDTEVNKQNSGVMPEGGVTFDRVIGLFLFDNVITGYSYLELLTTTASPLRFGHNVVVTGRCPASLCLHSSGISRWGPVKWPLASPNPADLSPQDFYYFFMCQKACENIKLCLEAYIALDGHMMDHEMDNRD
uniref:Uncharacterized protein n=1 Tax=Timema genevievae TaxID=629358 RepID=A0A7R9PQK2_TIMGE|nr:unnamed protein product [Timema genevievae]